MKLIDSLATLGIERRHATACNRYVDLMHQWNQRINLSAAKTRDDLVGHVVDSLHVVPHLAFASTVLDVGAGGGLPGVLVAICLPDARVVSLEPVNKKVAFLRTAARELGLANYEPRAERLEDYVGDGFDAAVSRATWDLATWLTTGAARVRAGGKVIGMEAVDQVQLGPTDVRHSYQHLDRTRAVVVRTV